MLINTPVAADGTFFGPHLRRNGAFQVGDKGDERRITDYGEALAYLKSRRTARWRRPNRKGNWGIVTAVAWTDCDCGPGA